VLDAYSRSLDAMLLEVVGPFLEKRAAALDRGWWERHQVGGPHVRIKLHAPEPRLNELIEELRSNVAGWMAAHPTSPDDCSPQQAAASQHVAGQNGATADLGRRNDVVLEVAPEEERLSAAESGAQQLLDDFRRASGPLALLILAADAPRLETLLRLFLTLALYIGRGSYPNGSVSFKSHWERFAATSSSEDTLARIEASYRRNRERLLIVIEEVRHGWQADRFRNDPLLEGWWRLLDATSRQAASVLEERDGVIDHAATTKEILDMRAELFTRHVRRPSAFVETMWSDEKFLTLVQYDKRFQRPRALVNLLYVFAASLGVGPLEKMALCYHAFRVVEETCACDLSDLLRRNMTTVVEQQAHRLAEAGAEQNPKTPADDTAAPRSTGADSSPT